MYSMKQACEETNMTYQALKYYCNEGLVPNVKRDVNNCRLFNERDVKWIKDLVRLKRCGMSIREMKTYVALCQQGETSIPQRKAMLALKRTELLDSMVKLKDCVNFIDWKQGFYDDVLLGKRVYSSNVIQVKK